MSDALRFVKIIDPTAIVLGGLIPRGAYNNATSYNTGDSVSYNGASYVAIVSTSGNLPTDTTKWQLIASQGAPGAAGTNGTNGAAATATAGTTTTLPAGSPATVTNSGTTSAAVFDFAIPQGLAGASSTPGGSNTQVQFNNAGVFGGSANFLWDEVNKLLTVDGGGTANTALFTTANGTGGGNANIMIRNNNAVVNETASIELITSTSLITGSFIRSTRLTGTTNTLSFGNQSIIGMTIAADGTVNIPTSPLIASNQIIATRPTNVALSAIQTKLAADAQPRINITAGGTLNWGDGALATDVSIARSGVGALAATGVFQVNLTTNTIGTTGQALIGQALDTGVTPTNDASAIIRNGVYGLLRKTGSSVWTSTDTPTRQTAGIIGIFSLEGGTVDGAYGVRSQVNSLVGTTFTKGASFYSRTNATGLAGTVGSFAGFYASNPVTTGAITSVQGAYIETQTGGTTNYGLQFQSGTDVASGIQWGTDTALYRTAVNTLTTDGSLNFGVTGSTGDKIRLFGNTYGIGIESSNLTMWSNNNFRWRAGGTSASTGTERMTLSSGGQLALPVSGSTAGILIGTDANLYRAAAASLKTDGTFSTGSNLNVGDGSGSNTITVKSTGFSGLTADTYSDANSPYVFLRRFRGTLASPTQVTSGSFLGSFGFRGANELLAINTQDGARISGMAEEDVTSTSQKTALVFYTNPTGSVGASERMRISGDGTVTVANAVVTSNAVTVTVTSTVAITTYMHRVNAAGATNQTLPTATNGKHLIIKNINATGVVTLVGTVDGNTAYTLSSQYKYVHLLGNGTTWDIIGNN